MSPNPVTKCQKQGWASRPEFSVLFLGLPVELFQILNQSALPCPPPGDLPHPGIEPASLMSPASAGGFFTTSTTGLNTRASFGKFCRFHIQLDTKLSYKNTNPIPIEQRAGEILLGTLLSLVHFYSAVTHPFWENPALDFTFGLWPYAQLLRSRQYGEERSTRCSVLLCLSFFLLERRKSAGGVCGVSEDARAQSPQGRLSFPPQTAAWVSPGRTPRGIDRVLSC